MKKITAKTPRGARNQVARLLRAECKKMGLDPSTILEREDTNGTPLLIWEDGPYDWPVYLTGGSGIFTGEGFGECGLKVDTYSSPSVLVECRNHYTLSFYRN